MAKRRAGRTRTRRASRSGRPARDLPAAVTAASFRYIESSQFERSTPSTWRLVDLIEAGLQSKETEKQRFFSLVKRLTESQDSAERKRLKEELARMTFGD